jgi:hypothetical protein
VYVYFNVYHSINIKPHNVYMCFIMFILFNVCSFVGLKVLFEKCDFIVNNGVNSSYYIISLFVCCMHVL